MTQKINYLFASRSFAEKRGLKIMVNGDTGYVFSFQSSDEQGSGYNYEDKALAWRGPADEAEEMTCLTSKAKSFSPPHDWGASPEAWQREPRSHVLSDEVIDEIMNPDITTPVTVRGARVGGVDLPDFTIDPAGLAAIRGQKPAPVAAPAAEMPSPSNG